jgi:hypothetical protein
MTAIRDKALSFYCARLNLQPTAHMSLGVLDIVPESIPLGSRRMAGTTSACACPVISKWNVDYEEPVSVIGSLIDLYLAFEPLEQE